MMDAAMHRRWRGIGLLRHACVVMMVAAGAFRVHAACAINQNGYVFLHPFFTGKNWGLTASEIDLTLPDTVCKLLPEQFSITRHLQGSNLAAFFGSAGGFHVMEALSDCPSCPCCRCYVQFMTPTRMSLASVPYAVGTPLYMLRDSANSDGIYRVLMADTAGNLLALSLDIPSHKIDTVARLAVPDKAYRQQIVHIAGQGPEPFGPDSGVWAAGTRGLVRYFPLRGGAWAAAEDHDIDTTETVLCVNRGFASTAAGSIYAENADRSWSLTSRSGAAALRAVSAEGAAGENGAVVIGDSALTLGSADYRAMNLVKRADGSGVELLDEGWVYRAFTYADEPTRLDRLVPDILAGYINGEHFEYAVDVLEIRFELADPDSNYETPEVLVWQGGKSHDLRVSGSDTLRDAAPGATCSFGALALDDSVPRIVLRQDSVIFTAAARVGRINVACGGCMWAVTTFRSGRRWSTDDSVRVVVGGDTLRIVKGYSSSGVAGAAAGASLGAGLRLRLRAGAVVVDGARGMLAAVRSVVVLDMSGRTIAARGGASGGPVSLGLPHSPPVVIVRVELLDGRTVVRAIALPGSM